MWWEMLAYSLQLYFAVAGNLITFLTVEKIKIFRQMTKLPSLEGDQIKTN